MSDVPGKFFIGQIRRSGTSGSSPGFLIGEADPPAPVNPDGTGVGVNRFTQLVDTPESYTGQNGKFIKVNSSENALEFGDADGINNIDGGFANSVFLVEQNITGGGA